jgi:hydrogenase maturation protein HypF
MEHYAQLEYKSWILGDKMAKEPRISALSYFHQIDNAELLLKDKFDKKEWELYDKMISTPKTKTSSMGRLFDAVASILGICDFNDFQGEAAMLLEQAASKIEPTNQMTGYDFSVTGNKVLFNSLLLGITKDKMKGINNAEIAYKFHLSLVMIISELALNTNTNQIAFSGGVFQNALLVDLIIQRLGSKFDLFFHKQLSPNDENISFGQIMHYNNVKV